MRLTVSGTSQIKHFDVHDNGELVGNSFRPARVNQGGRIQLATHFKSDAIAGSKVRYKGIEVAKVNAAGTAVVHPDGLPVGPLSNLSKPKEPIQLGAPGSINDAVFNGDGSGPEQREKQEVEVAYASKSELEVGLSRKGKGFGSPAFIKFVYQGLLPEPAHQRRDEDHERRKKQAEGAARAHRAGARGRLGQRATRAGGVARVAGREAAHAI